MNNTIFKFKPNKLIQTRMIIEEKHNSTIKNNYESKQELLDSLISRIIKLNKSDIARFAFELKSGELYLLADYMTRNKYNIDISIIYEILELRPRKGYFNILYNGFQKDYDNEELKKNLIDFLAFNRREQNFFKINNELSQQLLIWLNNDNIIKGILNTYYKSNEELSNFIKKYSLNSQSNLIITLEKYIFIYCSKEEYLRTSAQLLLNIIKGFNKKELVEFANNYLEKLQLTDLHDIVMNYLYDNFDKPSNKLYKYYWEQITDDARKTYELWFKRKTIKDFFGEDERSIFWLNYLEILEDYSLVKSKGQLFLDFRSFVVVEFQNTGNAAYIYSKEIFNREFRRFTNEISAVPNRELKDQFLAYDRIIHSGNWQYNAAITIRGAIRYA